MILAVAVLVESHVQDPMQELAEQVFAIDREVGKSAKTDSNYVIA